VLPYARHQWKAWEALVADWLIWSVLEAWCTMMTGIALWKWRVIQGGRDRRFYLALWMAGYGVGLSLRGVGLGVSLTCH
jgi:uncharacterized protein